jgi:hypothetical protein
VRRFTLRETHPEKQMKFVEVRSAKMPPIERLGRDQNRVRDTHFKKRLDKIDFARALNEDAKEI